LPLDIAQRTAAEIVGVSERLVRAAVAVKGKGDPVVFDALMEGRVGAMRAAEIVTLPVEDQVMLVQHMKPDAIISNHERIKKNRKRDKKFREIQAQAAASPAWPQGRFSVFYGDPAWEDDFGATGREVERHYPVMKLEAIKDMQVDEIATEDAVLYLWAVPHMVPKALEVMARWGFEYSSQIIWNKDKIGLGQWARNKHEVLLIGRKGAFPPPPEALRCPSVIDAPVGEHSEKPEIFAYMIEHWYPDLAKIELFRRGQAREGWSVWGWEASEAAA
jgi:N6-adenosine-specific RNA methylase IME4